MKELFTINDLAMMTSLSTRTLRNYIADGLLVGDKSSGVWQFTAEQVTDFVTSKTASPSIHAKKKAIVYDFLSSKPDENGKMCVVLDIGEEQAGKAVSMLCASISKIEPSRELRFSSEKAGKGNRIILSGSEADVMGLLNRYYSER